MTSIDELNPHKYPTNPTIDKNLQILFDRLLELQDAYGKPIQISSGLRDDAQQAALIASGKTHAIHSKHIAGAAADVLDKDGELTDWVKSNLDTMARIGFWMEDFDSIKKLSESHHTSIWVHVQIFPPYSGKRVFIP